MKNKFSQWLGITPAIVVGACVCISLSGYVIPDIIDMASSIENINTDEKPVKKSIQKNSNDNKLTLKFDNVENNQTYKDGKYIGEAEGFGGKVKVQVTVSNGKIADIEILSHSDGKEYMSKASALVNKIIKKQSTNVDAVSGATYSSNGIINAVRNALNKASISTKINNVNVTNNDKSDKTKITQKTEIKKGKFPYKDGTYLGKGEGYKGEITVALSIKNNTIDKIIIIDNSDDPDFFNRAKAILTKIVQGQTVDVDVVSGATFSSEGIIDSIKDALNEAKKATQGKVDTSDPDSSEDSDESVAEEIKNKYNDGVYTGYAVCFPDDYEDFDAYSIYVTVEIKQGKIVAVKDVYGDGDDYDTSNDWYINRAINGTSKYIGVSEQFCSGKTDIDAVSGATCSSKSIINATMIATIKRSLVEVF